MTIKRTTMTALAIALVSMPTAAVAQSSNPWQVVSDALGQLQRDMAIEQERKEAERRLENGESSYEDEQRRAEQNAQTWQMMDQMNAQTQALIEANRQRAAARAAEKAKQAQGSSRQPWYVTGICANGSRVDLAKGEACAVQ